jgi:uncharacterized protein
MVPSAQSDTLRRANCGHRLHQYGRDVTTISDEELVARYPDQPVDHDTRARYIGWINRQLLFDRCADCGRFHEPPAPICPSCWSTHVEPTDVEGTGTIYMAIFLHQGPGAEGVDYSTPYPVVVVDFDEQPGLRWTGTVVDASNDEIAIGQRVELTWIEREQAPRPAFRLVRA